jgi:predicted transcriptional regulator
MAGGDGGRTPLDDVDHLARSPHRAGVIGLLATDDRTRREIHEETGVPQPTLGRILGSFQDRGWLARDGDVYSLTLRGELIASHFLDLLDVFETVGRLPAGGRFEPLLELGFDPQWLAHVDVADPADETGWYDHLRRVRESVGEVERVRELGPAPLPGMPELLVERLRADGVSVESVFPREAFESFVADPEPRSSVAALLRGGNTEIHLVDEPVPCYIARHGDRAVFDLPSDTGGPVVRFTTGRRAVVDWVDSTIDGFRDRAETLAVEDLVD